jgi:RNA-directed DNA polymerase
VCAFARYADECNVYLGSCKAAEHGFETAKRYLEDGFQLQVNLDKSETAPANRRDYLGCGLTGRDEARLKVAPRSMQRLPQKVRDQMRDSRGHSMAATIESPNPLLRGLTSCLRCAQVKDCGRNWTGGSGASCGADCGANASTLAPEPTC